MPQRPGRHLDLFLVPSDGRALPSAVTRQALVDLGFVEGRGPGPRADELIPGGFAGFRLDEPGELRLYSNAQGGFRVRCPDTAVSIVTQFRVALSGWRQGGSDRLDCEACGRSHALYELDYAPRAAFGRGAVVLIDVASATPRLGGLQALGSVLGELVVVGARR